MWGPGCLRFVLGLFRTKSLKPFILCLRAGPILILPRNGFDGGRSLASVSSFRSCAQLPTLTLPGALYEKGLGRSSTVFRHDQESCIIHTAGTLGLGYGPVAAVVVPDVYCPQCHQVLAGIARRDREGLLLSGSAKVKPHSSGLIITGCINNGGNTHCVHTPYIRRSTYTSIPAEY